MNHFKSMTCMGYVSLPSSHHSSMLQISFVFSSKLDQSSYFINRLCLKSMEPFVEILLCLGTKARSHFAGALEHAGTRQQRTGEKPCAEPCRSPNYVRSFRPNVGQRKAPMYGGYCTGIVDGFFLSFFFFLSHQPTSFHLSQLSTLPSPLPGIRTYNGQQKGG